MKPRDDKPTKYHIAVGEIRRERWDTPCEPFLSGLNGVQFLNFDSVEDCLTVIKLSHVEAWKISTCDDSWFRHPVLEASIVTELEAKEQAVRNAYHVEQYDMAKELNAKPRFAILRITDCHVVFERTVSEYDPKKSDKISRHVYVTIVTPDGNHIDFHPENYLSSHTKNVLHQKLLKDMTSGWNAEHITKFATLEIDKHIKKLANIREAMAWGSSTHAVNRDVVRAQCPKFVAYNEKRRAK